MGSLIAGTWQAYLAVIGAAMIPIVEVKGAIPLGVFSFGLPLLTVFVLAIIGSSIPVPFILFFIKKLLHWLTNSKVKFFNKVSNFVLSKVEKHQEKVKKFGYLAIFIFVALPIPGTGVWTGSLLAAMLDLRIKYALPIIIVGNIVASLCMIFITHGINLAIGV